MHTMVLSRFSVPMVCYNITGGNFLDFVDDLSIAQDYRILFSASFLSAYALLHILLSALLVVCPPLKKLIGKEMHFQTPALIGNKGRVVSCVCV